LGLLSQVKLEHIVACLLQTFEGCGVLVIANSGNPAVVCPEVRSDGKKASEVGDELPREGPGWWHFWGSCSCRKQLQLPEALKILDHLLDECRIVAGQLEGAEALAGVKIVQHVQKELVEKSVLLGGDE
jgi:hypothetical protein